MKTVKVYEQDSYLREYESSIAQVAQWEGKPALVLEETIFYPLGGGQLPDRGTIGGAAVLDVQEKEGKIYHVLESTEGFAAGETVHSEIDWARRFDFMRQHTGEHILSGVIENHLGYRNVGFEINEEFMRVDYDGLFTPEQLESFEDEANAIVLEDRKVIAFVPGSEVIATLEYRSKKALEGEVRIVDVQGVDTCACCGTHVSSTAQVGMIKIIDSMHHRGGTRLTVLCGERALRDYRLLNAQSHQLAGSLSAPSRELVPAFERLQEIRQSESRRITELEQEIFSARLSALSDPAVWLHFEELLEGRDLARLSATLSKEKDLFLLFGGSDAEGYNYILSAKDRDCREIARVMNEALGGKGGGKPETVRGGVKAPRAEIERWVENNGRLFR